MQTKTAQRRLSGIALALLPLRLFEPVIANTVRALEQLAPEVIVPAHCTG
jgi:metal-dependent hydrolase (beta-lactamase superfamily II)